MDQKPQIERPSFFEVERAWKALLQERKLPAECLWVFDENLCFEPDPARPGEFRLGVQTRFTPPPEDAERIAYGYFTEFDQRIVFYRIGTLGGKSVCALLCDEWFESQGAEFGMVRKDEWQISFRPGGEETVPEITEEARWKNRVIRDRPLDALDFCLTLRAIHEVLAHGRVLSNYEHYALRFLHLWKRVLKPSQP